MKLTAAACIEFEKDISLYVDQELDPAGATRLVAHLEACEGCRDYVDDLRELAGLHREASPERGVALDATARMLSRHELFGSITRTLLGEKRSELSRLLYQLGKAYALEANRRAGQRRRSTATLTAPRNIRTTAHRARRVAGEGVQLESASLSDGAPARAAGSLFQQSRRLFSSSSRAGAGALARARGFLQQALSMTPDLDEARLYLGLVHLLSGRHDRARVEFRRVYRDGADEVQRMMALQFLGNLYSTATDYRRAVECYEEVVGSGVVEAEPRLFTSYLNLAVNCAKAGLVPRAVNHFADLVTRFPDRLAQVRELLARKQVFLDLLRRHEGLRTDLERGVPALFAA